MTQPGARALILDLDGTLVDTVYAHVIAWWESFLDAGHEVSCFDIHRAIGLGSSALVQSLIGRSDDQVVAGHSERWPPLRQHCQPFHKVPDLLRNAASQGLSLVFCTSGDSDDTADFRAKIGCDDIAAAVVTSSDVEHGKPAPDIVRAALEAVGASASDAVMLGDTVYDVRAAAAAGVACIGLMTGGIGREELQDAGAAAVYGNPSELLDDLAGSPAGRLLG